MKWPGFGIFLLLGTHEIASVIKYALDYLSSSLESQFIRFWRELGFMDKSMG